MAGQMRHVARALAGLVAAQGAVACAVKGPPPRSSVIDAVEVQSGDAPRVPPADVEARISTQPTSHLPVLGLLSGVPVLGALDALTVEYQVLDRFVLQRDLERVQRYYRARGFLEAQVTAGRVIPAGEGRVRIEIVVREGDPVWLEHVEPPKELIATAMRAGSDTQALLEASGAVGAIVAEYASSPVVDLPRCATASDPACLPKPRFDEQRYDDAKRAIQRTLADGGFAYARVDGTVDVDLVRHEARVAFSAAPGPLCTFGDVRVVGNGEIPDAVVRERLGFRSGDRYSTVKLDSAHDELAELGVFGSVEVRAELEGEGKEPSSAIPIVVTLQPMKLRTLKLGVGGLLGSQIEAHAIVGWEDRNLLGGLRTFAVEARPGAVFFPARAETLFSQTPTDVVPQAALLAAFKQPSFLERRTDLRIETSGRVYAPQIAPAPDPVPEAYNIVGYYELTGAVGLDRRFRFPRVAGSLYTGGFLRTQLDFPFSYNRDSLPPEYARVVIPYLDTIVSWDQRTDRDGRPTRIAPQRGMYAMLDAQAAFGDAQDVRLQPELRLYRPVGTRAVVALRWTFGTLFPFNYGESLAGDRLAACNEIVPAPPSCSRDLQLLSFRAFYSGGPFSNRGYGFREVGPHGQLQFATQRGQLSEFLPTGGMGLWELSAEMRVLLLDSLSWVFFVDTSDVVRTLGDFRLDHPHLAPGTGLRIATPVGPFRLDVGFRPPYLQRLGHPSLEPDEGGPTPGQSSTFPWAWSLAIGEAF